MALSPFDHDPAANEAFLGGASASSGMGVPPVGGLRMPVQHSALTQQALTQSEQIKQDALQAASAAPQQQQTPKVGYNFATGDVQTAQGIFHIDNGNMGVQALQSGALNQPIQKLDPGFQAVDSSQIAKYIQGLTQGRSLGSDVKEGFRQLGQGLTSDLPAMVNQAGAYFSPAGSGAEQFFKNNADYWQGNEQQQLANAPDVVGRGPIASTLIQGARALPPSLAGMASFAAGPEVGIPATFALFGGSQAQQTFDKVLQATGDVNQARKAAAANLLIEGGFESAADALGARVLSGAGLLGGRGLSGYAKDLLGNALAQSSTEYIQNYGEAAVENAYGANGGNPHEQGMQGAQAALGMSAILGPLGAVSYMARPHINPNTHEPQDLLGAPTAGQSLQGSLFPQAPPSVPQLPQGIPGLQGDIFGQHQYVDRTEPIAAPVQNTQQLGLFGEPNNGQQELPLGPQSDQTRKQPYTSVGTLIGEQPAAQPIALPQGVSTPEAYNRALDARNRGEPLNKMQQWLLNNYEPGRSPIETPAEGQRPGFELRGEPTPALMQQTEQRPAFELTTQDTSQLPLDLHETQAQTTKEPAPEQQQNLDLYPDGITSKRQRALFDQAVLSNVSDDVGIVTAITENKYARATRLITKAVEEQRNAANQLNQQESVQSERSNGNESQAPSEASRSNSVQRTEESTGQTGQEGQVNADYASVNETPQKAVSLERAQALINVLTRLWKNAPKITIVPDWTALPEKVKSDAIRAGREKTIGAAHLPEGIWIVANRLTEAQLLAMVFHEALGHRGLQTAYQDKLSGVMRQLYNTNSWVRDRANEYIKRHPETSTEKAAEEVLAAMNEIGHIPQSVLQRLWAVVREFFRKLGIVRKYDGNDLLQILKTGQRVITGEGVRLPETEPAGEMKVSTDFGSPAEVWDSAIQQAKVNPVATNALSGAKNAIRKMLTLHQVDDMYGKDLPPIKEFIFNLTRMGNEKEEMRREGDAVRKRLDALPRDAKEKVSELLTLNTVGGFQTKQENGKWILDLNKSGFTGYFERATRLWDGLSAKDKGVYRQIVEEIGRLRDMQLQAIADRVKDKGAKGQSLLAEVMKRQSKVPGDYFPLMRFGDHVVVWESDAYKAAEQAGDEKEIAKLKQSPKNYNVENFESLGEAQARLDELKSGVVQGTKGSASYRKTEQYLRSAQGVSPQFLDKLNELFADDKTTRDALMALYIQSLPEFSAAKRSLQRAGVGGYSKDARRTFASYIERMSSSTARMNNMDAINNALTAVSTLAKQKTEAESAATGKANPKYIDVADLLRQHYDALVNPKYTPGAWQTHATNLSYAWYLGMTPSFALTNLAQGQLISVPVIAARLRMSNIKVSLALYKGIKDAFSIQKQWLGDAEGDLWKRLTESGPTFQRNAEGEVELNLSGIKGLKPDEKDLLNYLYRRSRIDLTMEHDLGAIAEGRSEKTQAMMKSVAMFAHHSEILNRLSTGLAAYRLAKEAYASRGIDSDPRAFADRIIEDTHFNYSQEDAPLYFKPGYNPVAKIMFQFRKYQQAMLYLLTKNVAASLRGDTEAMRTLAGLAVMHGVAAGALGMPLAGKLAALVGLALNSADDPWDEDRVKAEFRNFLADLLGKDAAEVAANGILRAPGLRDVLPATINEKIGQGALGDVTRNLTASNRATAKESLFKTIGAFVAGPSGGLAGDLLTAFDMFGRGDYERGVEYATPKVIRDSLKTVRFGTQGLVDTRGITRVSPEKVSPIDMFWQAQGFTPPDISEYYQANAAQQSYSAALDQRRSSLVSAYATAMAKGDKEKASSIRDEDVKAFNAENPKEPILPRDLIRAFSLRNRDVRQMTDTGLTENPKRPERAEVGRFANVK
jgi:hypothetical protein